MKSHKSHMVFYSYFACAFDSEPELTTWSLKDFVEAFDTGEAIEIKKECPAINMSRYGNKQNANGGFRTQNNIESVCGLILDIDNKHEPLIDIGMIRAKLRDYFFVAHTTFSSTPEVPRYRVFIIFSKPTSPDHIPAIFRFFNKMFEENIDEVSGNPNQIFLIPAAPSNRLKDYERWVNKGDLFDPETVPYVPAKQSKQKTRKKTGTSNDLEYFDLKPVDLESIHIDEDTKYLIITGDASDYEEDRSRVSFRVICDLVAAGCSDQTIASILLDPDNGISARHQEKGLEWVLEEIERARQKDQKRQRFFTDVLPHFEQENLLEIDEASQRLRSKIASFVEAPSGYKGIKAPAGIGKTVDAVQAVANSQFQLVEYYVPRHDLGQEVAELFNKIAPDLKVQVIRGRTHADESGSTLCAKAKLASTLSSHGIGIYRSLCRSEEGICEHFSGCPYLAQFKPDTQVRIFTHAHLPLKRGFLDKELPDFAIIDESFFGSLIDYRVASLDDLETIRSKRLADTIRRALMRRRPLLLSELRKKFGGKLAAVLKKAHQALRQPKVEVDPLMDLNQINHALDDTPKLPQAIRIFLHQLEQELEQFPKRKQSRVVQLKVTQLLIAHRKSISRFTRPGKDSADETNQIPVLCIDADLCPTINKVFLPGFKKHVISVKRRAKVTQVSSTRNSRVRFMARRNGKGPEKQRARQHVRQHQELINHICQNKRGLIVGYEKVVGNPKKDIRPILRTPRNCDAIHFGALRGIDRYKDHDVVVIVGRHQYPTEVLEAMGASVWWDQRVPLKLGQDMIEEVRGYRLTRGAGGVTVMVHPDRRIQLVQEQLRESETLQAIDRLRLIYAKSPKEVWILSNVPLDIDVDRLVSWRDLVNGGSPIEQAFAQYDGVMPLSPQFLYENHRDLFGSETAAKKVVSRFKKAGARVDTISDGLYLIATNTVCHLFEYRVQGTPGKPKTALCDRDIPAQTVKKRLQQLHGAPITIVKRITPAADSAE